MDNISIANRLRTCGLRATQPRTTLLKKLDSAAQPLSVDEIFRSLSHTPIDRVTIYRTLEHFMQAGLVREIDLKRGHMLYELHDDHDHHHLVCITCGKTEDFTGCEIETLVSRALQNSKSFASISEHSLELFGTCTSCALV